LVRMKGFQKLTPVEDAQLAFLNNLNLQPTPQTTIHTTEALNRVLAEDIMAKTDLPRFDRAAVDGYVVRAEDTFGATQYKPCIFQFTKEDTLTQNQTKQVWTGNPLPRNASAVAMLEDTETAKAKLEVWTPLTPGENISKRGEDILEGQTAIQAGTRLKPHHLGLVAALGETQVKVHEKPKVAIIATGNELAELGTRLQENQIYDTNRLVLSGLCWENGAEPLDLGIAKDSVNDITERLRVALEKADLTLTSGGTSVGGADLVPDAVNNLGKPGIIIHGIAMRPAMPTALAVVNNKPMIILPGNPVAAIIGFEVFARPLLARLQGLKQAEPRPTVKAEMTRRTATTLGRKNYLRVHVRYKNGRLCAEPISAKGSSMFSTMTRSNGYVIVPEDREGLEKGEIVQVHMFDTISE
jgi:molybdopterin molybdotransferase